MRNTRPNKAFHAFLAASLGLHLAAMLFWQPDAAPTLGRPGGRLHVVLSPAKKLAQPARSVATKADPADHFVNPSSKTRDPGIRRNDGEPIDRASADQQISDAVERHVAAFFEYPWLARRRGWEGEVMLGLRLESDGRMSVVRVIRSSGYRILDRSAIRSAERVNDVPEAVPWLAGRRFDMVLPVRYRLVGS